jgi:hypothetical protein
MCSLKLSELVGGEAVDVMAGAVTEVAERCFFAAAETCGDGRVEDLAALSHLEWLVATVRFEEAGSVGAVACLLPEALALSLFDAFNGRDPLEAAPPVADLFDLVGEFANMVCGAWLTRLASDHAFVLSQPRVWPVLDRLAIVTAAGSRLTMTVNDLPLLVDVQVMPAPTPVPAGAA